MTTPLKLKLKLDRSVRVPLAEQIRAGIESAIATGVLVPGARLPSWRDLAAQLGVARGTVRAAYERLQDAELIVATRTSGTRVKDRPAHPKLFAEVTSADDSAAHIYGAQPRIFEMGVPAMDCFPLKLMTRVRARAARAELAVAAGYPDPLGAIELRREIAAHLAITRSLECTPSQIVVTAGFTGGLGLALRALQLEGQRCWMEEPCFPLTRRSLQLAQLTPVPIPVDEAGMDVSYAVEHAGDAALAIVTPGQQAPLGATLSPARRARLLQWAADTGAWIIEDDYLSELQLRGRAAPALAALDKQGRVIHIGTFSKTISPALRLGFVVVPHALVAKFAETAACLAPAPGLAVQLAVTELMRDGHYLRHLRRMKRIYSARRDALAAHVAPFGFAVRSAGLAVLMHLPEHVIDTQISKDATAFGMRPAPLSVWYSSGTPRRSELLLSVATAPEQKMAAACQQLREIINARMAVVQ